jgi:hypothetical protein
MTNSAADALVIQTVRTIRDRFGADGLRDLVALATRELHEAERAAQPGEKPVRAWADPVADVADTQAWIAFTDDPNER